MPCFGRSIAPDHRRRMRRRGIEAPATAETYSFFEPMVPAFVLVHTNVTGQTCHREALQWTCAIAMRGSACEGVPARSSTVAGTIWRSASTGRKRRLSIRHHLRGIRFTRFLETLSGEPFVYDSCRGLNHSHSTGSFFVFNVSNQPQKAPVKKPEKENKWEKRQQTALKAISAVVGRICRSLKQTRGNIESAVYTLLSRFKRVSWDTALERIGMVLLIGFAACFLYFGLQRLPASSMAWKNNLPKGFKAGNTPRIIFAVLANVLYFALMVSLISRGASSFGKSKAKLFTGAKTTTKFDDVAGVDEAKEELQEVVDFLRNPARYARIGAKLPKGILLCGPAGTGKTLLARAVAGEAGVSFFSIAGSEFVELYVGVGAARVRHLFAQAKRKAPCIIFFDEVDTLGRARSSERNDSEREQTLNQMLTQMDGFEPNLGVVVLAATNRPEVLDPAFRRPGRFDRQVLVNVPDRAGRKAILQVHSKNVRLADDVDFNIIAGRTTGFSGAGLANLMNESALLAVRRRSEVVHMEDVTSAIQRVIAGVERRSALTPADKRIVAYHECGQALIGALVPGGTHRIHRISVVPRAGLSGHVTNLAEEEFFIMPEDELRGRIAMLLAGRAAEQVIFGKVTTRARDDIRTATKMAERAINVYGMSRRLGPMSLESGSHVAQFALESGREIKALVDSSYAVAVESLTVNRNLLEHLANTLIQLEVMEGDVLLGLIEHVQPPDGLHEWLRTGTWRSATTASRTTDTELERSTGGAVDNKALYDAMEALMPGLGLFSNSGTSSSSKVPGMNTAPVAAPQGPSLDVSAAAPIASNGASALASNAVIDVPSRDVDPPASDATATK